MLRMAMICLGSAFMLAACTMPQGHTIKKADYNTPVTRSAIYSCDDGTDFIADFRGEMVTLSIASGPSVTLPQKRAASGLWYGNGSYDLRGKGLNAVFRAPKRQAANCRALD
jgi:membrane-bound inhibitor of C-type lysozyme